MPLKSAADRMFGVQEPHPRQPANASVPASRSRERSQHRTERRGSTGQAGHRQPVRSPSRAERAQQLKIPVPNAAVPAKPSALKHQTSYSTVSDRDDMSLEADIKEEPKSSEIPLDESTQITTGEDDWEEDPLAGEQTARWVGNSPSLQQILRNNNLQHEADSGRRIYGNLTDGHNITIPAQRAEDTFSDIDGDDAEDFTQDMQNLGSETPSRAKPVAAVPATKLASLINNTDYMDHATAKSVNFVSRRQIVPPTDASHRESSPLDLSLEQQTQIEQQPRFATPGPSRAPESSIHRHLTYKQHVDSIPPTNPAQPAQPAQLSLPLITAPAKVSGTYEASDSEQPAESSYQPASAPAKRPHEELDYDLPALEKMTYADLSETSFLNDPRVPQSDPPFDLNGNPIPLAHRLANLSKLSQQDQANLFRSLSDGDNEEVGQWFLSSMQDDLQKLMERRLERRKISLKYEMEIRKREAAVDRKTEDVQEELEGLRKGGGELIKDRTPRGVGTPRQG